MRRSSACLSFWGFYSVPGWAPKGQYAEWHGHNLLDAGSPTQKDHDRIWGRKYTYDQFVPLLTGEGFNADEWTSLIQKAGAKYVVVAANFHDGFAMHPTKYAVSKFGDRWNAYDRGPHRDLLGELQSAATAKGLKMGIYYSLCEWWHSLDQSGQLESMPWSSGPEVQGGSHPLQTADYISRRRVGAPVPGLAFVTAANFTSSARASLGG